MPTTRRTFARPLATRVDAIEQSLENSLKETHSIESHLQDSTSTPIPTIDTSREQLLASSGRRKQKNDPYNSQAVLRQARHRRVAETTTDNLGSTMTPHYDPNELLYRPPRPSQVTLEMLLAAQAHLGHSTSLWNPMNSRYIFGERHGIHIISLDVTAAHLRRACQVVHGVAEHGGLILYVGTRPGQDLAVVEAAKNTEGCHLFEKWKPGSITNAHQILRNGEAKAVDQYDRLIEGYEDELNELPKLKPDLVVCLNPMENWVLLHECGLHNVPTIGVIDTNADPTWVTYPIPANDDSIRCTNVIAGALGMAGKEGTEARRAKAIQGEITYNPVDLVEVREEANAV